MAVVGGSGECSGAHQAEWLKRRMIQNVSMATAAEAGMVKIHAQTMRVATPSGRRRGDGCCLRRRWLR